MPRGVNRRYAACDLIARLYECRAIRQWHAYFHEQFAIEFSGLAHVLAAFPEIEFRRTEYITRIGKNRLAAFGESADMVGVPVRGDNDVDIGRFVAGHRQPGRRLTGRKPLAELLI